MQKEIRDNKKEIKKLRLIEANFIKSAQSINDSLEDTVSEVVFLGRSNVGKSSTINGLTSRKSLAKSSATPGKTQLINFFDVKYRVDEDKDYEFRFVDLPGFGYAKVSKSIKHDWEKNLTDYISMRTQIKLFIHLIDCRHPHLDIDTSVSSFLLENVNESQYILQIFTKIDKLNQKEQNILRKEFPEAIMVSSSKKKGLQKVLKLEHEILLDGSVND